LYITKTIWIHGESQSGKTSLLQYIFKESFSNDFIPLLLQNGDSINKIDKLIKRLFQDQYSDDLIAWERYQQTPLEKRLIMVDDIELISARKSDLLEFLSDKFGAIVLVSISKLNTDIYEVAQQNVKKTEELHLHIQPMYKSKRSELVKKICYLNGFDTTKSEEILYSIDQMVTEIGGLFSLSPDFILKFLSAFLRGDDIKRNKNTIFGAIFESDITHAISENTNKINVDIFRVVLDELAYYMHFNKMVGISIDGIKKQIEIYNKAYQEKVDAVCFIKDMEKAKIIIQEKDLSYRYRDKNILAYFVALHIKRNLNPNVSIQEDLNTILHDVCFGINGTIVLFLSYLTSSIDLIKYFISQAEDLLVDFPELDADGDTALFLKSNFDDTVSKPTHKDRKLIEERIEDSEKNRYNTSIKYANIYDYTSDKAELSPYRIARALRLLDIISKSLTSIKGVVKSEDKDLIVDKIYTLPNKILYAIFKPQNDNFDGLVSALTKIMRNFLKDPKIEEEEARSLLIRTAWSIVLSIYDTISFNCVDSNSINSLDRYNLNKTQYKIHNLLMHEQLSNTTEFTDMAISLYDNSKDFLLRYLVREVCRVHILVHPALPSRELDRINSKLFNEKQKSNFILERGKFKK
jgi:hypothetical protein